MVVGDLHLKNLMHPTLQYSTSESKIARPLEPRKENRILPRLAGGNIWLQLTPIISDRSTATSVKQDNEYLMFSQR